MVEGKNWWVIHQDNQVRLLTKSNSETIIPFEDYKYEVLKFVDKVQGFYESSKPKTLPKDEYDKDGYLKLWKEWELRRNKWK
jgi:hypothetical protein